MKRQVQVTMTNGEQERMLLVDVPRSDRSAGLALRRFMKSKHPGFRVTAIHDIQR